MRYDRRGIQGPLITMPKKHPTPHFAIPGTVTPVDTENSVAWL
jgi:hypothetical protein